MAMISMTPAAAVIGVKLDAFAADDVVVEVVLEGDNEAKYGPYNIVDGFQ